MTDAIPDSTGSDGAAPDDGEVFVNPLAGGDGPPVDYEHASPLPLRAAPDDTARILAQVADVGLGFAFPGKRQDVQNIC